MRKVRVSFHEHLRTAGQKTQLDLEKVVYLAEKRLGKGGVVGIVDYDDPVYEELTKSHSSSGRLPNSIYFPREDILLVKCEEVPCQEQTLEGKKESAHLLGVGLPENEGGGLIPQNRTILETISNLQMYGAAIIADHPTYIFGLKKFLDEHPEKETEILSKLDGVEVFNSLAALGLPLSPLPLFANHSAQRWYGKISVDHPSIGAIN